MSNAVVAAIDGWYTLDDPPQLIGSRCLSCGTYFFPRQGSFCRNPACAGTSFEDVKLSRTGRIWSYTNACYQPPPPFVAPDPFRPFAIAAVELAAERMIVLGQVAAGFDVGDLRVGMDMELVLEPLHSEDGKDKVIWKWKPMGRAS
ncbi:MAG: OB-fold domain-containing protein [Proteobacteria bacterium]|nr:OB-fold domain-containing protein [Pseudomonadota bacterium]